MWLTHIWSHITYLVVYIYIYIYTYIYIYIYTYWSNHFEQYIYIQPFWIIFLFEPPCYQYLFCYMQTHLKRQFLLIKKNCVHKLFFCWKYTFFGSNSSGSKKSCPSGHAKHQPFCHMLQNGWDFMYKYICCKMVEISCKNIHVTKWLRFHVNIYMLQNGWDFM